MTTKQTSLKGCKIVMDDLKRQIKKAGGQKQFAEKHQFSKAYINYVVNGKRHFTARLLKILGWKKQITITYIKE